MITPAPTVEVDPEPDIEGHNRPFIDIDTHNTSDDNPEPRDVNHAIDTKEGQGQDELPLSVKQGNLRHPDVERVIDRPHILKPRSWPGRARSNHALGDTAEQPEEVNQDHAAVQVSAGTATPGGRLAPLKKLSIPLPPKMGPPEEEPKVKKEFLEPTWGQCFKNTIKSQPALGAVPVLLAISWALHFTHQNPVAVFVTSLLAIVPLAGGLGFATEELAHRVGEAWGGLLNATFGNAVELLIAILALVKGEIDIVQASMVGSILSNVLLVLGMSYFAGGLRFHEQLYTIIGAQMHISLLGLSLMAIVLPAAYHYAYPNVSETVSATRAGTQPEGVELANLLKMSRGLSFMLLAVYGMFLTFQLYTHAYLFRIPREKVQHPLPGPVPQHEHVFPVPHWGSSSSSSSSSSDVSTNSTSHGLSALKRLRRGSVPSRRISGGVQTKESDHATIAIATAPQETDYDGDNEVQPHRRISSVHVSEKPLPVSSLNTASTSPISITNPGIGRSGDLSDNYHNDLERASTRSSSSSSGSSSGVIVDEDGTIHVQPKVKFTFALCMLLTMTALAGVTAEWLVDSIDGLTSTRNVSREFVGLILLPVIGNSVEHITAVTVSVKDKLNLSMSIAVGSSIQVSLCLLPILVLVGWAIGQPMLLFFDGFETITLVISILLVNFAISDGRTNYLEGFVLMMAYLAIALVCWFYDPAV